MCSESECSCHNVVFLLQIQHDDGVMRTPKRCFKYASTRNFHHQIVNIIMPDILSIFQYCTQTDLQP